MNRQMRFLIPAAGMMLFLPACIASAAGRQHPSLTMPAEFPDAALTTASQYRVLLTETGEIAEVPAREYLIGAVAAELPAEYEYEALKAQAVASHTYAERIRRQQEATPDPALNGADFSDDSSKYQAFYTDAELHTLYGDAYDRYYSKIASAVTAVEPLLICMEDEPIVAAFHAVSDGMTENAADIWGQPLPYLVSVSSEADQTAPQFEETVTIPLASAEQALRAADPEIVLPEQGAEWFGEPETTPSGTVLRMRTGNIESDGQKLRELFHLRSACFTVEYCDGQFRFTTKGYGHGVGMSQYGANMMARSGATFDQILLHYYSGASIQRCKCAE